MSLAKPTNIDAQRILAVLSELKERLTLLSVITPQVLEALQNHQQESEIISPDVFKSFCEQIRLEDQYVLLNNGENGDGMQSLLEKLSKNTIDVSRKLKQLPGQTLTELRALQENRPQQVLVLIRTIGELEELMLKRFNVSVEEERSRQEMLEWYIMKVEGLGKKRLQLEKHLSQVRVDREKAGTSRTEVLTKLKADLLDTRESTDYRLRALRDKYESKMKELSDKSLKREEQMLKDINTQKDQLKNTMANSQEIEVGLRRKKKRNELEIEELVNNYDGVMKSSEAEYLNNMKEIGKEKSELEELEGRFAKLDCESQREKRELALENLREKTIQQEKDRLTQCANLVQAYWKGLVGREAFIKLRKAKKGKKGKK